MVNWNVILSNPTGQRLVQDFCLGNLSRDKFISHVPTLRNFVRERGTSNAKSVARKALRRRGVNV